MSVVCRKDRVRCSQYTEHAAGDELHTLTAFHRGYLNQIWHANQSSRASKFYGVVHSPHMGRALNLVFPAEESGFIVSLQCMSTRRWSGSLIPCSLATHVVTGQASVRRLQKQQTLNARPNGSSASCDCLAGCVHCSQFTATVASPDQTLWTWPVPLELALYEASRRYWLPASRDLNIYYLRQGYWEVIIIILSYAKRQHIHIIYNTIRRNMNYKIIIKTWKRNWQKLTRLSANDIHT